MGVVCCCCAHNSAAEAEPLLSKAEKQKFQSRAPVVGLRTQDMKRDVSSAVCDFFEVKSDNRICRVIADFTVAPVNLGDFTLQRILGSGSFSVVTLVIHRDSLVKYALKMMNKNSPIVKRRKSIIFKEVDVLSKLKSCPFIIDPPTVFHSRNFYCQRHEFLPCGDLRTFQNKIGHFNEHHTRFYSAEIVSALIHLHKHSIIYRDLKPENVLLTHDGHIKIVDWSLAIQESDVVVGDIIGTPQYMAPEQLEPTSPYTTAADWWALGVMMYEMMTGSCPWQSDSNSVGSISQKIKDTPPTFPPFLHAHVCDIIARFLHLEPKQRLTARQLDVLEQHRFWMNMKWDLVHARDVNPPIALDAQSATNFDEQNYTEDFFYDELETPYF